MKNKNRIVMTAILGRVMVGNILKDGTLSASAIDRTNDFLITCIEYLKKNGNQILEVPSTNEKYSLILQKLPEAKANLGDTKDENINSL